MKKILSVAALALAALWLTPGTSSAGGTFGLFTQTSCWPFSCFACCDCGGCCGCGKFSSTICVKPYNAFSPTCSGSLYCDGFCPLGRPGNDGPESALPPLDFGALPTAPCCDTPATSIKPHASDLQPPPPYQPATMPPQAVNTSRMWPNAAPNYGPMQVGYYYPTYTPAYNYGYVQPMAVPYYWNSNSR